MQASKTPKLLLISIVAVIAAALAVAGCGGGSGGSGGEPAGLAPKKAPVYIEVNLAPDAKTSEALDEVTQTVLGIENVGEFVAEELESAALGEGEKFDFEKEVEPWLGEKAGMYLARLEGEDFVGYGIAIETTDSGEAEEFIEKRVEANDNGTKSGEFEGHKYYVEPEDESVLGMIGDYLAFGETKADFEEMVEAFESEGLNEAPKYKEAIEAAPDEGIGNVYVDIGGLIEQGKSAIPPEAEAFFGLIGIEPKEATAVATVIPHSEQVEIDLSSDIGKTVAGTGDASKLLESLPENALVGFAASEFGKSFGEGLKSFSEQGVPGQLEPGELEAALDAMGFKLESLGETFGDVAGFAEGTGESNLGGAIVVETTSATEARKMVADVGLILRASGTPGVTAINGNISGFSVRSAKLGPQPLIVGASGEKLVIAYGPKAAANSLRSGGATLGSSAEFQAGKSALGSTPISAFVKGGPTLKVVETMLSPDQTGKFAKAKPYVEKIAYLAIGSESKGKTSTAKVIVGLQK
jgi:uncharacterized protein DUF3352